MISIIIPCQKFNPYLQECLEKITRLNDVDFEVIVVPDFFDQKIQKKFPTVKILASGKILPGAKRNLGARNTRNEILAFIDDDAYPDAYWLKNAIEYFTDESIAALGGPGITPIEDSFSQQVSGAVYLSWLSGANPSRYFPKISQQNKKICDWPSMNFFIRRDDFLTVGGFDENIYPGEDTVLCRNLIKFNKKIIYAPDVIVYHHRRRSLFSHLKQVFNHQRGVIARNNFLISDLKYLLPVGFLFFVIFGWLLLFLSLPFVLFYKIIWLIYSLTLLVAFTEILIKTKKILVSLTALIYIPLTHLAYALGYLRGFLYCHPVLDTGSRKIKLDPDLRRDDKVTCL